MAVAAAGERARSARHRLDPRTKSVHQITDGPKPSHAGPWLATYYPEAKEATLTPLQPPRCPRPKLIRPGMVAPTAEQLADNARRAIRRARGEARRHCRANGLRYLWVMTYRGAGCHDWPAMVAHVEALLRELKPLGVPVLIVPEWHPNGHGLHLNVALGQWIDWRTLVAAWPHGNVQTPRPKNGARAGRRRMDPGQLASYVAGYIAKGESAGNGELGKPGAVTGTPRPDGAHRYFKAHCGHPRRFQDAAATLEEAAAFLARAMGCAPSYVWRSWDTPEEEGEYRPVAVWCDFWPRRQRRKPR